MTGSASTAEGATGAILTPCFRMDSDKPHGVGLATPPQATVVHESPDGEDGGDAAGAEGGESSEVVFAAKELDLGEFHQV